MDAFCLTNLMFICCRMHDLHFCCRNRLLFLNCSVCCSMNSGLSYESSFIINSLNYLIGTMIYILEYISGTIFAE